MKTPISEQNASEALSRWRGGVAKVWLYHVTHRRLALRIERHDEPDVLYIVANGCEHVQGPFVWRDAEVVIVNETGASGENVCRIVDVEAGFELRCSTATLVRGPNNEVDESFDGFLGDGGESVAV